MFTFLSKNTGPEINNVVYLNEHAHAGAINEWVQENPGGIVVAWFRDDLEKLKQALPDIEKDRFVLADRLPGSRADGKKLLFAGHYPLRKTEVQLCEQLGLEEIEVYTHLDTPFFRVFAGDQIKNMMIKMGMKEHEAITHPMINDAVRTAQDKISKTVMTDMHASSEDEWVTINTAAET